MDNCKHLQIKNKLPQSSLIVAISEWQIEVYNTFNLTSCYCRSINLNGYMTRGDFLSGATQATASAY